LCGISTNKNSRGKNAAHKEVISMKKLVVMLMVALLALSAVAFAEPYRSGNIAFEYDEKAFEISLDDNLDDETTVVVYGKNEAWGHTYVSFYLKDLNDGEKFPTADELAKNNDTTVTEGDWNGYKNVLMYTVEGDDGMTRSYFVVPVMDDDGHEIDDMLEVQIGVSKIDDEATTMERDDAISAVVDSLKLVDD
jgi:hypothetical protein